VTIPGVPKRLRPLLKEILETLSSPNKVLRSREKKVTISAPRLLWEVNMTLLPWGENHPQPPPHILGPYLMSIINWGRTRDSMNNRTSYTNDMIFCYSWGRGEGGGGDLRRLQVLLTVQRGGKLKSGWTLVWPMQ
jgi:hypothetical protein